MADIDSIRIFGVRIDNVDLKATLDTIDEFIRDGKPHMVVTADTSCVVISQNDAELKSIVNSADLVTPDGTGILWAARRFGFPLKERVPGVDTFHQLCARGAQKGQSVFLLGSAPGVAEAAAARLKERFPGLIVAGTHHGFFDAEESDELVKRIHDIRPDMLFVAMGIPMQEKWISRNLSALGVPVCMGVGGTLDVASGRVKRAPEWMQRRGIEWIYRSLSNPRKIRKFMTLPIFGWMVIKAGRRASGKL